MQYLIILCAFLTLNVATDHQSCMIEIEKEQLLETQIVLSCEAYQKGTAVIVEEFTIKFPGYPSEVIKGGVLDAKTRSYLNAVKPGDVIVIFDIKKAKTQTGEALTEVPPFNLQLK